MFRRQESKNQNDASSEDIKAQPPQKKIKITATGQYPKNWPLSRDLSNEVAAFARKDQDAAHLQQSCRFLYLNTQDNLKARKKKKLQTYAHYVVVKPDWDNKAKVINWLLDTPALLKEKIAETKDRKGRTIIDKTLFQLAYGAGDDDLCAAMKSAFIKLCGSEAGAIQEMQRQIDDMSETPEEEKKKDEETKSHFIKILAPVIKAISDEQFDLGKDENGKWILSFDTLEAIRKFREDYAKSQPRLIDKGRHQRPIIPKAAFDAYAQAEEDWRCDDERCKLFEDGVLIEILDDLPVNDGQHGAQGYHYHYHDFAGGVEPFRRSLELKDGSGNFYERLREQSLDFSGLEGSCVNLYYGRSWKHAVSYGRASEYGGLYMSRKDIKLAEFMQPTKPQFQSQSQSQCVIL